jgi:hypothetical protein
MNNWRNKMPPKSHINFPNRKISETFLHYAEPLLVLLGPDPTDEMMEQALKMAFTVWNTIVYEKVNGDARFLDMLKSSYAEKPDMAAFIADLIDRKRFLFGDDDRLIGEYKLFHEKGELRLRAEARDPRVQNVNPQGPSRRR